MNNEYLKLYKEKVEEAGILLVKDMNFVPPYEESHITPYFTISIHQSGLLKLEYDMQAKRMIPHKVSVLLPHHVLGHYDASDDFKRTQIILSSEMFQKFRQRTSYKEHIGYHREPECILTDQQWDSLMAAVELLSQLYNQDIPNRMELELNLLDIILQMLNDYNSINHPQIRQGKEEHQLFTKFYDAIIEHYTESRNIKFYADLMGMSPKYFAHIIKNETGITASEWIDNYVILQAKRLISEDNKLSLQEISRKLGFAEQASFCRYFKHLTGFAPSALKKQ